VTFDNRQWVNAVAETLGHLAALTILNHRVNIDITERNITEAVLPHHHHTRHPQRNNLTGGTEHIGRIKRLERRILFRPAHRAERPQGRRKPCIEYIIVPNPAFFFHRLFKFFKSGLDTGIGNSPLICLNHSAECAVLTTIRQPSCFRPNRYLMPPPQLPADRPVAEIFQPGLIVIAITFRIEFQSSIQQRPQSQSGQ